LLPGVKATTITTDDAMSCEAAVDESPDTAVSAVMSLLDSPTRPSIIFTSNNDMAQAVLKAIFDRGLTIGKDISLVTVDDSTWLEAIQPGITVARRPVDESAQFAVEQLVKQMENLSTRVQSTLLPTELVARGSIAQLT
jgi:LacI family transcriptional regulator